MIASLDALSDGRVRAGDRRRLGGRESAMLGVPFAERAP